MSLTGSKYLTESNPTQTCWAKLPGSPVKGQISVREEIRTSLTSTKCQLDSSEISPRSKQINGTRNSSIGVNVLKSTEVKAADCRKPEKNNKKAVESNDKNSPISRKHPINDIKRSETAADNWNPALGRSTSKVVLRRWLPESTEREDTTKKRHSLSFSQHKKENSVFRPVSCLLTRTPWEKDFKDSKSKSFNALDKKESTKSSIDLLVNKNNLFEKKQPKDIKFNNDRQDCLPEVGCFESKSTFTPGSTGTGLSSKQDHIINNDLLRSVNISTEGGNLNDCISSQIISETKRRSSLKEAAVNACPETEFCKENEADAFNPETSDLYETKSDLQNTDVDSLLKDNYTETDEMSLSSRPSYLTSRTTGGSYQTSYDTPRKSLGLSLQRGYTFDSITTGSYSGGYSGSPLSRYNSRTTRKATSLIETTSYGGYSSSRSRTRNTSVGDRTYDTTGLYSTRTTRSSNIDSGDDIFCGSTRRSSLDRSGESSYRKTPSLSSSSYNKYSYSPTRTRRSTSVSSETSSGYGTDSLRKRQYREKEAGIIISHRPSDFLRGTTARNSAGKGSSYSGSITTSSPASSSVSSYKGYELPKTYSASKRSSLSTSPTERYHFSFKDQIQDTAPISSRLARDRVSDSGRDRVEDVRSRISSRTYDREKEYLPSKDPVVSTSKTSKESSYTPERQVSEEHDNDDIADMPSHRRLVKVESSYVGQSSVAVQSETESKEKDAERKMAERMISSGLKDNSEKDSSISKERRSSALRRSFRRKSKTVPPDELTINENTKRSDSPEPTSSGLSKFKSSLKQKYGGKEKCDDVEKNKEEKIVTSEEISDIKQKPDEKRERQRSLLWRLSSRKDDQTEPILKADKSRASSPVVTDISAVDQPGRKSPGLSGYLNLRRSLSKKKKSQEGEKEVEKKTQEGEKEVKKKPQQGEKDIEKKTQEGEKEVNKKIQQGEKEVDKKTQEGEKEVEKRTEPCPDEASASNAKKEFETARTEDSIRLDEDFAAPLAQIETYDDDCDIKPIKRATDSNDDKILTNRNLSSKMYDSTSTTSRKFVPQERPQTSTISTENAGINLKGKKRRTQNTNYVPPTLSTVPSKLRQNDISTKSIAPSRIKPRGNVDTNLMNTKAGKILKPDKSFKVPDKTVVNTVEEAKEGNVKQLSSKDEQESEKIPRRDLGVSSSSITTSSKEVELSKAPENERSILDGEVPSPKVAPSTTTDSVTDTVNKHTILTKIELHKKVEMTELAHKNATESQVIRDDKIDNDITKISRDNFEKPSASGKRQFHRKERRVHRAVAIDSADIARVKEQLKGDTPEFNKNSTIDEPRSMPSAAVNTDEIDAKNEKNLISARAEKDSKVKKIFDKSVVNSGKTIESTQVNSSDKLKLTPKETAAKHQQNLKAFEKIIKETSRKTSTTSKNDQRNTPTAVEKMSPFGVISKFIFHKSPSIEEKMKEKAVIDEKVSKYKFKDRRTKSFSKTESRESPDKRDTKKNTANVQEKEESKSSGIEAKKRDGKIETDGVDAGNKSWTTRSVIKDKIRQKKSKAEYTKSLPVGIELSVTGSSNKEAPPVSRKPVLEKKEKQDGDTEKESKDDSVIRRNLKTKLPRPRPKTMTSGIDPSLLLNYQEQPNVIEERLSVSQIKERLILAGSGRATPITPDSPRKSRRRSGKRYKTITEGIAPGILEAAHQYNDSEKQENHRLDVDHLSRISAALGASTENVKRRSFVVSEVSSLVGSLGTSLATSLEDLSTIGDFDSGPPSRRGTTTPIFGIMEDTLSALKKLPIMLEAGDEADDLPSVSSLRDKFLKNVEDSHKKTDNRSTVRRKFRKDKKDRPHTISGLDEFTMQQIEKEIERNMQPTPAESLTDLHIQKQDTKEQLQLKSDSKEKRRLQKPIINDDEIEMALKESGISADALVVELGLNPSLASVSTTIVPESTDVRSLETDVTVTITKSTDPDDQEDDREGRRSRRHGRVENEGLSIALDNEEITVEHKEPLSDMDFVSQQSSQLTSLMSNRRNIKPQRKLKSSPNPLKTLKARDDIRTEVGDKAKNEAEAEKIKSAAETTSKYRGAGRESCKSVGQKLWRKIALATEATAALAGTEDFSAVKLKKIQSPEERATSPEGGSPGGKTAVKETKITKLLLLVKGRRHVQTRVVEFSGSSVSTHDSIVVVTPKELYCWHGKKANVIEKAKAAEIASRINQKKEMGCKALDAVYVEEDHPNEGRVWKAMDLEGKPMVNKNEEDDEDYEKNITSCNMVYRLQDSDPPELVPDLTMCNRLPSKEILKTNEAYVFDFVSEVYVWIGRQTTSVLRRKMQLLGRQKFDEGYYWPEELLTTQPHHHHHGKSRKISMTEGQGRRASTVRRISIQMYRQEKEHLMRRPPYAIFVILFEEAEWILFKEKFCDWPDESRIIRMKGGPQVRGELNKQVVVVDVKPVDPKTMVKRETVNQPILPVFEGIEIGRGQGKPQVLDGQHIFTREIQIWHVSESHFVELSKESHGQFHSSEGFVIRWEYAIVAPRVLKMLSDINEAKNAGRNKCGYFFWLGNDCPITEKGATAVMTVELDKERGPQIRIVQGKEPPCFLNLFNGGMIIHAGKRPFPGIRRKFTDHSLVRLYCARNEETTEACLLQVPVSAESLRSRSSFVLLLCTEGEIFLWHGCKSSERTRNCATQAAHRLIENHPIEASLSEREELFLSEVEEGHEPEVFWVALGGKEDYGTLLHEVEHVVRNWDFSPRLFLLNSASGQFLANEVTNPSMSEKASCPFPFLQDDLYDADQPAIFIVDAHYEVYLWLGWFPDDEENEANESQRRRWDIDKGKAMESTLLYCTEVNRPLSQTYVVYAGLEPASFTHLFPYWIVQEDITDIQQEENLDHDRKLITEELKLFSKNTYTIEELRRHPRPQGVDPTKIETYLSDDDFYLLLKMDRKSFAKIPKWRQANLKKRADLY